MQSLDLLLAKPPKSCEPKRLRVSEALNVEYGSWCDIIGDAIRRPPMTEESFVIYKLDYIDDVKELLGLGFEDPWCMEYGRAV